MVFGIPRYEAMPTCCTCVAVDANLLYMCCSGCQPVVHVLQWMPTCCTCVAVDANLLYMCCSGCQPVVHVLQWMPTCCTCVAVDTNLLYMCCSGCGRAAALPVWSWSTLVACVVKELVENFTDSLFGRVQLLKPDICSFCGRPLCNIQMAVLHESTA